jgi:hypothetical protein
MNGSKLLEKCLGIYRITSIIKSATSKYLNLAAYLHSLLSILKHTLPYIAAPEISSCGEGIETSVLFPSPCRTIDSSYTLEESRLSLQRGFTII